MKKYLLLKQKKTKKDKGLYEEVTREFIQYRFFENKEKAQEFIKNNSLGDSFDGNGRLIASYSYRLIDFEELEDLNERPKEEK